MGGADIIPGVSGGTVALVLGIYQRLVTAISHCDLTLLFLLRNRRFRLAAQYLDLRFLISLGLGIGLGVLTLASVIHALLTGPVSRPLTLAAFLGAILASSLLVVRLVEMRDAASLALYTAFGLAGALFAFELTQLPTLTVEPSYGYVFLCGMVAICAMILPGISGAYILLLLGMYAYMTDLIKALPRGEVSLAGLTMIAVFLAGCTTGLLAFSKVLRWLLAHRQSGTMAVLCGFMIGALEKVWPFQRDLTPAEHELKYKNFENYLPTTIDGTVIAAALVTLVSFALVMAIDWYARRQLVQDVARQQG